MKEKIELTPNQARILDILDQIQVLNQMIDMHQNQSKDALMAAQYLDMQSRFMLELRDILSGYKT